MSMSLKPKRYRANVRLSLGSHIEYTRQLLAYREQMKSLQRNADQIRAEILMNDVKRC